MNFNSHLVGVHFEPRTQLHNYRNNSGANNAFVFHIILIHVETPQWEVFLFCFVLVGFAKYFAQTQFNSAALNQYLTLNNSHNA